MSDRVDLSFLDRPEILQIIFPVVYSYFPELEMMPHSPQSATAIHYIYVDREVRIGCGFWVKGKEYPTILYFHGNGETIGVYDDIALLYNQIGINFFVADYRGYGLSNGKPTITNLISDSLQIFKKFREIIEKEGFKRSIFLMGRSLGSLPALEIAFHHQDQISGLITESGTANNFRMLWQYLEPSEREILMDEKTSFLNKIKIRQVKKPTLIIHGQRDTIVSPSEGEELFENSGAEEKEILRIANADHNTIIGADRYFSKIEEFVKAHC